MSNAPLPTKSSILSRITKLLPITSIVDVGVRECTAELVKFFPSHKQYLFEPVNLFFSSIERIYKRIDYDLFPMALSNENSTLFLTLSSLGKNGNVTHSTISTTQVEVDGSHIVACDEIDVKRFDSLPIAKTIAHDFLLKIDVDGEDLNVVKGFGGKLSLASVIIIECTYNSAIERISYLQNNNFVLIDMVDLVYYGASLYQFDAVMVRKDLINSDLQPPITSFDRSLWKPLELESAK